MQLSCCCQLHHDDTVPLNGFILGGLLLGSLALSGCSGGGGGGDTSIAFNEQDADPVALEIPIAYVKRTLPADLSELTFELTDPLAFNPGARLLMRSRASNQAEEVDLTPQILGIVAAEESVQPAELAIDIKDLDTSFDGQTLIFAARVVPQPIDTNLELTTWNIWTYSFVTGEINYLIPSRLTRNEGVEIGGGQDVAPHFLTDDRIVFSSSRQVTTQARQLNEGRAQLYAALDEDRDVPATLLHIYEPQSNSFQQLSFNQSHDLDPTTLASGEILFSRWNRAGGNNQISLHRINPSGLQSALVYGHHSGDTGSPANPADPDDPASTAHFVQPREMEDGRIISVLRQDAPASLGGNIVIINKDGYVEHDQPVWGGAAGSGQSNLTNTTIRTDDQPSPGGQYSSVYPLQDGTNRALVSWSPCRVIDSGLFRPCSIGPAGAPPAPPLYGLWVYDSNNGTQQPVVTGDEGFMLTDLVAAEPRSFPAAVNDGADFDSDLANENMGRMLIDNVYDIDGVDGSPFGVAAQSEPGSMAFSQRPLRFIRIVQPVPIPDEEIQDVPNFAFGVGNQGMREIVGYSLIEPDGSVTLKVPANSPFMLSRLDVNGRRVGERHDHWLQLAAGETLRCTGCHTGTSELPHGRIDSQPPSSNPGAQALGGGTLGFIGALPDLFAVALGDTMAEVYDARRPNGNESVVERSLELDITYTDQWSDTGAGITPDPDISYTYDPNWTDIPAANPIIVPNLDPQLPGRIVINYVDHIQPIWERQRTPIDDGSGNLVDRCTGCHTSNNNAQVPPGQLDLTATPSDLNPDQFTSYRELLSPDTEQWLNNNNAPADRIRECTVQDENGNDIIELVPVQVASSMSAAGANNSTGFFGCFEVGPAACGSFVQDTNAPPANCIENGTLVVDTPVDHSGLLSPSELRLISEWLDIGAQYFNNPFDPRLTQ